MIDGLFEGLSQIWAWPGPLLILAGLVFGSVTGVIPGMGGATATALVLPLTFTMDPYHAIAFIIAVNVTGGLGGQLTSILVNVPGDPPNAATMIDGYPMTKQGRAAEAIGAATYGSIFGAIGGTLLLIALIPVTRQIVLAFSYPEFLAVAIMGLVMIAVFASKNPVRAVISTGIGLCVAFIGLDPVTGNPRFTFGELYLWDGLDLVPVLIGLFAGAEMLALFGRRGEATILDLDARDQSSRVSDGFWAVVRGWKNVLISSVIGFVVGIIPGVGGTVASFMAYGRAARMSKEPETFGKGQVQGVIAPETANDADKSGALLPTIAFGIPGGASMAIILAALLIHGFPTGPSLLGADTPVLYIIVFAVLVPRIIAAVGVLIVGKRLAAITKIPGRILAPIVTVFALVAVFAIRNQILDVVVTLVFGYIGFVMEKYGFSRVALVIALVLGRLIEASFHQTANTMGLEAIITRPISATILLIAVGVIVWTVVSALRRRRSANLASSPRGSR